LTDKEYYILLASLLYSVDKVANTVGHFDAYFKKEVLDDNFIMKQIDTIPVKNVSIFREDANMFVKNMSADVVCI